MKVKIVGILNLTPDSFSGDSGPSTISEIMHAAQKLVDAGADYLEIGGDSTRPGSTCAGPEEEWRRIGGSLRELSRMAPVIVDTHHAEVAARAVDAGVTIVNDISGGSAEMLKTISQAKVSAVLMHSASPPHNFTHLNTRSHVSLDSVMSALSAISTRAIKAGIKRNRIILDPGMGAFSSSDPKMAWELVFRFQEFFSLNFPLYFAVSRKGFLKGYPEQTPTERDGISALCGIYAARESKRSREIYLRVHNVQLQKDWLTRAVKNRFISVA